jgi:hypothetical protein
MKFLRWRLRNKTGLFGGLWYLSMSIALALIGKWMPEIRCMCLFMVPWCAIAAVYWFFMVE